MNNVLLSRLAVASAMLITCATLTVACTPVRSSGQHRDPAKLIESADTNGDGVVTHAEFLAARERAFSRLDRNTDGFVDASDAPALPRARRKAQGRLAELVAQLDKNGDGRVSEAEFIDGPTPLFDRADFDHNGELSREEAATLKRPALR